MLATVLYTAALMSEQSQSINRFCSARFNEAEEIIKNIESVHQIQSLVTDCIIQFAEFFQIIIDFVVSNNSWVDLDQIWGRHFWQLDNAGDFLPVHHHLAVSGVVAGDN